MPIQEMFFHVIFHINSLTTNRTDCDSSCGPLSGNPFRLGSSRIHSKQRVKAMPIQEMFFHVSDFIWPFLRPYMGVIPNPKMAFIFPISCILALIFPILIKYFPKCVGKGNFPKSQIKSLHVIFHIKTLTTNRIDSSVTHFNLGLHC